MEDFISQKVLIENLRKYSQALFFENQIFKLRQTVQNHCFFIRLSGSRNNFGPYSPRTFGNLIFINFEIEDVWKVVEVFTEELEQNQLSVQSTSPNNFSNV